MDLLNILSYVFDLIQFDTHFRRPFPYFSTKSKVLWEMSRQKYTITYNLVEE